MQIGILTNPSPNTTSRTFDIRRNSNFFREFRVPTDDKSCLEWFTGGENSNIRRLPIIL
ncbi:hypothetical protein Desti_3001 [Desulfomonile tiedjei DSM 6799]|uniref:Uncharacterized protein n=1 Tax=Desulfomonile tiedjei (strain ATCC 49306 / DSM 6799 / DCB-1) TaxID=706587 RepID=I4C7X6_DESTA|nr:hypothetical protein Desti_3001 [Desulfomonile tiedjei DSM 6799]